MLEKQLKEPFLSDHTSLKIRRLRFSVCGKERYEVNYESWTYNWVEKNDIFFVEDLSPFLKSIYSFPHNDDSIEIPQGSLIGIERERRQLDSYYAR